MDKNLNKKKLEVYTPMTGIIDFSVSSINGKRYYYWLDKKGEIWKDDGGPTPLIGSGVWVDKFALSPNGEYIAYEQFEGYSSCCGGAIFPVTRIWIMNVGDGRKVKVERPSEEKRELVFFNKWFPDSKKILFYLRFPDEVVLSSPFYEVGLDGKNPKKYTAMGHSEEVDIIRVVVGSDPVFSPDGTKIAYIKDQEIGPGIGQEVWIANIDGTDKNLILKDDYSPFGWATDFLSWSTDSSLLLVKHINELFIFSKEGKIIWQRKFGEIIPDYSDISLINSAVLSIDNKYVGGVYKPERDKPEIIFLENIVTRERKEFILPGLDYPGKEKDIWLFYLYPQFFSRKGNFYYLRKLPSADSRELWVIDTNTWKNYKVADDVSKVVRIP